jgi:large subunit ribosomal protein L4
LSDDIFGIEPNDHAIYLAVKSYNANQRQGTSKSKERSEVRGGGKNPGSKKEEAAQEPVLLDLPYGLAVEQYSVPAQRLSQDLPKKVKRLARKSALSYKVKDDQIMIVEDFNLISLRQKIL